LIIKFICYKQNFIIIISILYLTRISLHLKEIIHSFDSQFIIFHKISSVLSGRNFREISSKYYYFIYFNDIYSRWFRSLYKRTTKLFFFRFAVISDLFFDDLTKRTYNQLNELSISNHLVNFRPIYRYNLRDSCPSYFCTRKT